MTEVNRKIHVIGINSYSFEDLPSKLQDLFLKVLFDSHNRHIIK